MGVYKDIPVYMALYEVYANAISIWIVRLHNLQLVNRGILSLIFFAEYAFKAAKSSEMTSVGVRGSECVVLATQKKVKVSVLWKLRCLYDGMCS